MINDEQHLVALAKTGDTNAFKELYSRNKEKIFNLTFQYTRNRQDAEDLLQETFSRAFLSLNQFKALSSSTFSTWLYRIGINCSINFIKKRGKQIKRTVFHHPLPEDAMVCEKSNPEHTAAFKEMVDELEMGLGSLSPNQRMIFTLKHNEGLKVKDIAQLMKCSEGSVKKQLNRAVTALVKKLSPFSSKEDKNHEKQLL